MTNKTNIHLHPSNDIIARAVAATPNRLRQLFLITKELQEQGRDRKTFAVYSTMLGFPYHDAVNRCLRVFKHPDLTSAVIDARLTVSMAYREVIKRERSRPNETNETIKTTSEVRKIPNQTIAKTWVQREIARKLGDILSTIHDFPLASDVANLIRGHINKDKITHATTWLKELQDALDI